MQGGVARWELWTVWAGSNSPDLLLYFPSVTDLRGAKNFCLEGIVPLKTTETFTGRALSIGP